MDLRQLRQFVAVAEERSFRRAAERLHVSQPPLSVAVQKLEADVGVALLDRTRHHVRLTVAGEAFLREAKRTLSHAQLSIDIAQRAAAGKLGTLRLSFVPSAALNVVPGLLRAFRQDYSDVTLVLTSDTTSQQMATLLSGAAEIAGGVGVLVRSTRVAAGWGLIALLLAVFPANVHMLQMALQSNTTLWYRAALWLRLPLQALLIWWVWRAAVRSR